MLLMIGVIPFQVAPLNATGYDHSHATSFAEKQVLGTLAPLEYTGEGPESWTINGVLFPHKFGGLDYLTLLYQTRQSGTPQYMMRGDGLLMGWVVIERVTERSSYLQANGVGKVINLDVSVRRAKPPGAAEYFSALLGLFS